MPKISKYPGRPMELSACVSCRKTFWPTSKSPYRCKECALALVQMRRRVNQKLKKERAEKLRELELMHEAAGKL